MKKDELTLDELDKVTAGVPKEEKDPKREKFVEDIKVEEGELTLEELDKVTAGVPKKEIEEER